MDSELQKLSSSPLLEPDSGSILRREFEVLGAGGAAGIGRGLKQSVNDLGSFSHNLAESPVSTLGGFVKDHWSEAAVAAGIAFIAPRKYMHLLLLAASGRGLALATIEGAAAAADPNQSLSTVKERFSANIAGETRLLANSLPMTLAGAAAGRSLANLTFGRNLGAYDLASGKVTMADVKTNLWRAHDMAFPPKAKLAVLDLDGTLVSTSRHLARSIEEGTKQLAKNTGLSEPVVATLMQEQFGKLKSFVNPWTVELALAEKLNVGKPGAMSYEQFRQNVSEPYWKTFDKTLPENLLVYEGVKSTLARLAQEKIPTLVLTNSPAVGAIPRLKMTGLSELVPRSFMLDNAKPPQGLAPELLRHGAERLKASMSEHPSYSVIERAQAKPSPQFLLDLMKKENLRPGQVMVIGDSLESDMLFAQRSGTRGLWARWAEIDKPFDALLNKVSGGNFPPAKTAGVPFEKQLNRVPEILDSLRPQRDLRGLWRNSAAGPQLIVPLESYGLSVNSFESRR